MCGTFAASICPRPQITSFTNLPSMLRLARRHVSDLKRHTCSDPRKHDGPQQHPRRRRRAFPRPIYSRGCERCSNKPTDSPEPISQDQAVEEDEEEEQDEEDMLEEEEEDDEDNDYEADYFDNGEEDDFDNLGGGGGGGDDGEPSSRSDFLLDPVLKSNSSCRWRHHGLSGLHPVVLCTLLSHCNPRYPLSRPTRRNFHFPARDRCLHVRRARAGGASSPRLTPTWLWLAAAVHGSTRLSLQRVLHGRCSLRGESCARRIIAQLACRRLACTAADIPEEGQGCRLTLKAQSEEGKGRAARLRTRSKGCERRWVLVGRLWRRLCRSVLSFFGLTHGCRSLRT